MSVRDLPPLDPCGSARQRLAPAPALSPAVAAALREADLPEEALYLAWQTAAWAEGLSEGDRASLAAIVGRSLVVAAAGSTRLAVDAAARALLAKVPAIVGGSGDRTPLVLEGAYLYHRKLLTCEERVVAAVRARAGQPGPFSAPAIERALVETVTTAVPPPSEEQQAAVAAALRSRLCVVSGGPGTGKTTIVLALVRALVRLGIAPGSLALAAPTGKAANRLEESVRRGLGALADGAQDAALAVGCPPAQTLHRLLGYVPATGGFRHHENNRLAERVVIVDEGSMVDLFLMDRLLRALGEDATLVILGDADQLPSVEAGAVFRDLAPLAVRLTRSFRMDPRGGAGRRILEVATRVNAGDTAGMVPLVTERATPAQLTFDGVELIPAAAREALLERWYLEKIASTIDAAEPFTMTATSFAEEDLPRLAALHAELQRFRILCVTRARPTGVEAVNGWLHQRAGARSAAPLPGEPVMVLRNDYDRGLFNGDQGVVIQARNPGRPRAWWSPSPRAPAGPASISTASATASPWPTP